MIRESAHGPTIAPPPAPVDAAVLIRRVETLAEYRECVALQEATWGEGFSERVPSSVLLVTQKLGGVVAAAFAPPPDGRILGFVFGMTGVMDGRLVHWSDLLAVRPEARGAGIGELLKRYQRALVRAIGVETMRWTFDPLVARNAHLNLTRLGARVAEYVEDMYGGETGSPLHGAIGTDRLIVEWDVPAAGGDAAVGSGPEPRPRGGDARDVVRIEVPPDIHALLARDPDAAVAWRRETRAAFRRHLDEGRRVVAFDGGRDAARPAYLLAPRDLTD